MNWHPHRGFETVTIAFQGGNQGQQFNNSGGKGPGDVQWMADAAVIREEYHSTAFATARGTFEMCQLWLNLPAKDKMHAPTCGGGDSRRRHSGGVAAPCRRQEAGG